MEKLGLTEEFQEKVDWKSHKDEGYFKVYEEMFRQDLENMLKDSQKAFLSRIKKRTEYAAAEAQVRARQQQFDIIQTEINELASQHFGQLEEKGLQNSNITKSHGFRVEDVLQYEEDWDLLANKGEFWYDRKFVKEQRRKLKEEDKEYFQELDLVMKIRRRLEQY
eukprot:Pgem_evm1s19991